MEKDFLKEDLPKERKDTVKYLIKYRINTLFRALLFLMPFALPFFGWTIFSRYYFEKFIELSDNIFLSVCIRNFPNFFFIFLYGAGFAGIYYIVRRLLFSETVRVSYHFFKGVKDSGFEFGLFSLIIYLIYTLSDILVETMRSLYLAQSIPYFTYFLINALCFIVIGFLYFILSYIFASSSLYVASFNTVIKDAFKNGFKDFFKNLGIFLISFFPLIFLYPYQNSLYMYVNLAGMIILLLSFNVIGPLISLSRIFTQFDETINKISYPNYYKRGL